MSGFPQAGVQFLHDLRDNNNKEWWEENKQVYVEQLREPALVFIQDVGEKLRTIAPNIQYDLRVNGSGSLMRPYRDTRFSKDKTPYKTNVAMTWWEGDGKRMEVPGFGFQISLEGSGAAAGMFGFPKPVLEKFRQAVADDKLGAALENVIEQLPDEYTISGAHYKRVPRGYDNDHPRAELLKYNALWASSPEIAFDVIASDALSDVVFEHFKIMHPVQAWLVKAL